ncbi:MAG: DUF4430 domain-containing protein [Candidatus Zixiibacteriota bacterium]|nr:MAG: DUF4430 domain-containing protein [candidate division Zixibacteria bacterium]
MSVKRTSVAAALTLYLAAGTACSYKQEEDKSKAAPAAEGDSIVIELVGQTGVSVFEITARSHIMDYDESSAGVFVRAIDSIEAGAGFWWRYSVNDTLGQVACDKYITHDGDRIRWYFGKQ